VGCQIRSKKESERVQQGPDRWGRRAKRTRPKAARLRPEQVDDGTTDQLFDDELVQSDLDDNVVHGRHFAANGDDSRALRAANENVVLDLVEGRVPLIRYEWRNRAGETMVVEAAWPFDRSQSAELGVPGVRRIDGNGEQSREAADRSTSRAI
jgi:hypothetical protein